MPLFGNADPRDTTLLLGREVSNLRMAESKSAYFPRFVNTYSEKSSKFDRLPVNRLASCSEWGADARPTHIQGGVVPKPPANFTRLDPGRSDVGMLIGAMLRAREVIATKSWSTSQEPTSKKSVQRLKARVANLLTPGNHHPWLDVRDALNGFLFGWARYFSYGTHRAAFRGIDYYVYERVRDFLARRHKIKGRGTNRFSYNVVYGERGVLRLERLPWSLAPCASR